MLLMALAFTGAGAQQLTVNVEEAGTLESLVTDEQKHTVMDLKLTGELNGYDFIVLRDMCGIDKSGFESEGKLENLDISEAAVVSGGDYAITGIYTSKNKFGKGIFKDCTRLKSIKLPEALADISKETFKRCTSLTSVDIPASVETIGNNAFEGCTSLVSIDLPSTVTDLSYAVFIKCTGLTQVTLPSSIKKIGQSLFDGCTALKSIAIPESVTIIDTYAFQGCSSLESVTLPSTLTNLEKYSFAECTSLEKIDIPAAVTLLGGSVFKGCSLLKTVYMHPELKDGKPVMNSGNFDGIAADHVIYVPSTSFEAYKESVLKDYNLQPYDYTGIDGPALYGNAGSIEAVYSPGGQQTSALRRGLNIVKYSDGTTRKVILSK